MIRDEDEFAKKLTGYLDAGAAAAEGGHAVPAAAGRAAARSRAWPHRRGRPRSHPAGPRLRARVAAAAQPGGSSAAGAPGCGSASLLIAAAGFGYQQWQVYQQTREIEELDAQILSSDLPIDAYLDRGFQTWLTRFQP